MKPHFVASVGFMVVMAVGAESLTPSHNPYDLPHAHYEIPHVGPLRYLGIQVDSTAGATVRTGTAELLKQLGLGVHVFTPDFVS